MSEADGNGNYETPAPDAPDPLVIPTRMEGPGSNAAPPAPKPRGKFRNAGKWFIPAVIATAFVSWIWNRPADVLPNDPTGVLRDDEGCELQGRTSDPEDFACAVVEDLDLDGAAAIPDRTYIQPLPEGESGRVGYNRVNAEAASPTDLGGPGIGIGITA